MSVTVDDKNINDDNNADGGDNYYVCSTIKGLFSDKNRQNVICALLKGEKPNEKMGLIAGGMRCGNYIKTDNNSLCIKLLLQCNIIVILLRD